jgi:hypothetical protein
MTIRSFISRLATRLAWTLDGGDPSKWDDLEDGFAAQQRAAAVAERRAATSSALALAFFGLGATSWEAGLLWFLPK